MIKGFFLVIALLDHSFSFNDHRSRLPLTSSYCFTWSPSDGLDTDWNRPWFVVWKSGKKAPQNKTPQAWNLGGNLGTMGVTAWPHPTPLLLRLLGGWRVGPPCNHWHRPAPRHWGPGSNSCDPTAFSRPRHCRGRSRGPTLGAPESAREDNQGTCFCEVCCYVFLCL